MQWLNDKIRIDVEPFCLTGTVYGTLLNQRSALAELGDKVSAPPYNAAPRAPVLYIKPRNTLCLTGSAVQVPAGTPELETGACLGLVIGRTACRVRLESAMDHVTGYVLLNDFSIPHDIFYRPSIPLKARDGFCPLGPKVTGKACADPDDLVLRTYVDGRLVQELRTADAIRPAARLLADVTEFMTLVPGDVLATGIARPSPRVRAGQRVDIVADALGTLSNSFVERA